MLVTSGALGGAEYNHMVCSPRGSPTSLSICRPPSPPLSLSLYIYIYAYNLVSWGKRRTALSLHRENPLSSLGNEVFKN